MLRSVPATAFITSAWSMAPSNARRIAGLLKGGWRWLKRMIGDRPGRFPDLHRHAGVAGEQRHLVGAWRVEPIDLALQQCRDRGGGIAEATAIPHDQNVSPWGRPCSSAVPSPRGTYGGEPFIRGPFPRIELGGQKTVWPAADHLGNLTKWIGSGQALRHDARHSR